MRDSPVDFPERQLVLVGGGHAHVEVLRRMAMDPPVRTRIALVSPGASTYYSGMLPGFIAGEYMREEILIDLEPLARKANAKFYRTRAAAIDPVRRRVELEGMGALGYDVISFDIGSTAKPFAGAAESDERVLATRPFPRLLARLPVWDKRVREAERATRIAIVGAGAAGFELALALGKRYAGSGPGAQVTLYDGAMTLNARKLAILARAGIAVRRGVRVRAAVPAARDLALELDETGEAPPRADLCLFATGADPLPVFRASPLADEKGYLRVNESLESPDFAGVFGAGDCISFASRPLDKAGVFAVREAPVLTDNLYRALRGETREPYRPQRVYLRLLNEANKRAVLQYGRFEFSLPILWNFKNYLDTSFMRKYRVMALAPLAEPDCGGCGSKLAGDALAEALGSCALPGRPVEARDDVAVRDLGGRTLALAIDHFKDFGVNPFELGKIAAIHALGDFFAKGLVPNIALANVVLERAAPGLARSELELLMNGARSVFGPLGVDLAGGQTTMGEKAAAGFALIADTEKQPIWKKEGVQPGDALLLTKGLGTGVVLAAAMRFAVRGEDLEACLSEMQKTQEKAMEVLRRFTVHAATDVTGFGLAGHLVEMLGSGGRAMLDLKGIPALPAARELLARGYRSRMWVENLRAYDREDWKQEPLFFDPQTSGALLVALPEAESARCLAELRAFYPNAAQIGKILAAR